LVTPSVETGLVTPFVERKYNCLVGLDTRSVIPAEAGIQRALLWIPAYAGKTIEGRDRRSI
jgi:hypothetical protein